MSGPERPERLAVSLRGLAGSLIEFISIRLELVGVEAREEVLRLGELLLYGAIAVVLLSLGLTFLAVLLTVLLWDSHRLLALAVFATVFLTLGRAGLHCRTGQVGAGVASLGCEPRRTPS